MSEKRDKFTGHWLVSEYVFNPNGTFAGIVRQRRYLEAQPNGKTRVIQHCTPQAELASHPMGLFSGERVFDLRIEGRKRLYHGPDVVGMGLPWGDSAMMGRGVWPRFGHNFSSFAILPTPQRQITGGKFFKASEMIANIIGVAVPEVADGTGEQFPELTGGYLPYEVSQYWRGTLTKFSADGTRFGEEVLERRYKPEGWQDETENSTRIISTKNDSDRLHISGDEVGIGKRVGWLLDMTLVPEPNQLVEVMEVFDNFGKNLVSLRRIETDGLLSGVEIIKLKPDSG